MDRPVFETRLLRADDAEVLGPLHNRLWRVTYRGLVPDAVLDARRDDEAVAVWRERGAAHEAHGQSPQGGVTTVLTADGVPVGHAAVGPGRDEDAPAAVELWSLYLAPELQGTGGADVLLDASLPSGPAYLWVLQGNDRAIAYYRKRGFAPDGTTKPLWDTGSLELRMVRPA